MSNQLFSYSVQTGVPQARTNLQLVSGGSPLGLETTQGQSKSAVTFSPRLTGDYRMPTGNKTAFEFRQPTGSAGTMGKSEHFTSSAPNGWLMPAYKVPDRPIHHANGLDHYSQRIPGAGFLIPRVRKQADAHPHVTNVIKMLSPQF
jgi:hypothetical protein